MARRDRRIHRSAAEILAEERRSWERDVLPVGRDALRPVRERRPRAHRRVVVPLAGLAAAVLAGALAGDHATGAAVGVAIAVSVEAAIAAGDRADNSQSRELATMRPNPVS